MSELYLDNPKDLSLQQLNRIVYAPWFLVHINAFLQDKLVLSRQEIDDIAWEHGFSNEYQTLPDIIQNIAIYIYNENKKRLENGQKPFVCHRIGRNTCERWVKKTFLHRLNKRSVNHSNLIGTIDEYKK